MMDAKEFKEKIGYASVYKHSCSKINAQLNSVREVGEYPSEDLVAQGRKCVDSTIEGVNSLCADAFDTFMNCKEKDCFDAKKALVECAMKNSIGADLA